MTLIFFFYGLAFILMGLVLFSTPKKNVFIDIGNELRFLGLFGLVHGFNEWIDLFIWQDKFFDVAILKIIGSFILPLSFIFLVVFGALLISRSYPVFKRLKFLWIICILVWGVIYFSSKDVVTAGIAARYFICLPGIFLSVLGLVLVFLKNKKEDTPKLITFCVWLSVFVFIIYGFLSGLIVPEKIFLLASFINQANFQKIFGFPVQFFRMLCAIILAISFYGSLRVCSYENGRFRVIGGIRRKLSLIVCALALAIAIFCISIIYVLGFNSVRRTIGEERMHIARLFSTYITQLFDWEIAEMQTYVTRPLWKDLVQEKNLAYQGMSRDAIVHQMQELDKEWVKASPESALVKPYIDNRVAVSIRDIMQIKGTISEMYITDRFGGLAAASGKTTDFYQADEDWWQQAYNRGAGAIFVGDVEYDESSGSWVIPVAAPIRDKEKNIIGICKDSVAIQGLFKRLEDFKIRKTGHLFLVNSRGQILFHKGLPFLSVAFSDLTQFQKMTSIGSGYGIISNFHGHKKDIFTAFALIDASFLSRKNTRWFIFVDQDAQEAFRSLDVFIGFAVFSLFILVIIVVPVGHFIGVRFAEPIHSLHVATEEIMKGNWEYKIDIKTGDEIEQFADTFRDMILNIRYKQKELIAANKEIEALAVSLEKKVASRTKELGRVNEATLNILEDLTVSKEKLDVYAKELETALAVKSDFTSMVSHELRTPLTAIKEGIAIVLDKSAGDVNPQQKEFLELAKRNVDRLARLINDVLDFQKLESGRMEFVMHEEDVNAIIEDVCQTMRSLAKQKNIELVLSLGQNMPLVTCDRDTVVQVLTNFVSNAVKFTDHGSVTVVSTYGDNFVKVGVTDTGIGIKHKDMPKLFQKFSQLVDGNDRKTGGSGLGLAISKEIVERHKGKITVESTYGQGSSFFFILPIHERRV